jgi:hypothetical protein
MGPLSRRRGCYSQNSRDCKHDAHGRAHDAELLRRCDLRQGGQRQRIQTCAAHALQGAESNDLIERLREPCSEREGGEYDQGLVHP